MKRNHLREIYGEKIRWQYFSWAILILIFCMFFVPYCIFVFSLSAGDFNVSNWFSDLLICVEVCFAFSIPFVILSILNQQFFGKIICVINENGIYYQDGLLKWDEILKIEYEIELSGGVVKKENLFCHSVIYTRKDNIKLIHTPLFFISKVKKYNPSLDAKISKNSIWMIVFFIVLLTIAVPIIPLFT